jgi:hypothetical protein
VALVTVANAMFSGSAFAAPPPPPPPAAAPDALVAGTPCTALARACVDLDQQKAWLIQNGKVIRGPVAVASGGAGQATPTGDSFRVYRKDKDHKSQEYKLPNGQPAPMPWSVFFADGGIAFHSGDPNKSSGGCIHLSPADAVAFFNNLQLGDHVQVRKKGDDGDDNSGDDNSGDDNGDDGDDNDSSDDGSSDNSSDDDNGDDNNGDSGDDDNGDSGDGN